MSMWSTLQTVWRQHRLADDLVGINRRNVDLVYASNPREHYPLVDDKLRCKALLESAGLKVAETVARCDGLFDVPRVMNAIASESDIVIKPANASGGDGIVVLCERESEGWRSASGRLVSDAEVHQHFANIVFGAFSKSLDDNAFVERRVVSAEPLASWSPAGLSDIRVIVHHGSPLLSMIRIPTQASGGRANLHQGGVGVAVDLESGRTTRALWRGRPITHHPETNAKLVDEAVPNWAETVALAVAAAAVVPLGYLGVDIVLDESRGPLVLEMNARPGLEIQNVTGVMLGTRLREVSR
jgi:alpha-L-glutamate ligase-like protein